jgi:actin-related protein 8
MLLRKVLEMLLRRNPTYSDEQQQVLFPRGDLGELDQLPSDILFHILRLLGPKEVAKLSVICKSLRFFVSDNRLWLHFLQTHQSDPSWDSVFFAETNLTSGYPLPLVF